MPLFTRRQLLETTCALALGSVANSQSLFAADTPQSPDNPNILVIMADDMGYSDIGCFGAEIPTPHLDRLAANGVRMMNFHNAARCCPSRAALVTGLYNHRVGIGYMTAKTEYPGYQDTTIHPHTTIAEVANKAGYLTGISGKWHITRYSSKATIPWEQHCRDAGWTWADTVTPSGTSYFWPFDRSGSTRAGEKPTAAELSISTATYVTEWYADGVANYIDRSQAAQKPFMIYWAPTAPHYPLQCKQDDLDAMKGLYDAGPEAVAQARYEKLIKLGLVDKDWPYEHPESVIKPNRDWRTDVRTDADAWPPAEDYTFLNKKNKAMGCARAASSYEEMMEIYAAMVVSLDREIGRIVDKLAATGALDNTMIMFCSDNGSSNEKQTPGHAWAQVSNTPYKKFKKYIDGGGCRTPMVMHWPAGTPQSARGSINRSYGHLIDIMPTIIDVAGGSYPVKDRHGRPLPQLPGRSLRPLFAGEHRSLTEPLFFEHSSNLGVITEEWKLVSTYPFGWRLYNLKTDQLERQDLAGQHPEVVKDLAQQWQVWATANFARPGGHKRAEDTLRANWQVDHPDVIESFK